MEYVDAIVAPVDINGMINVPENVNSQVERRELRLAGIRFPGLLRKSHRSP
jgi:hypothetical protein